MVDTAAGRVAVIGVLDPRYATDQIEVSPPQAAVLEAIESIPGPCEAIVVLAYLPEDALRRFAETLPEVQRYAPIGQTLVDQLVIADAVGAGDQGVDFGDRR